MNIKMKDSISANKINNCYKTPTKRIILSCKQNIVNKFKDSREITEEDLETTGIIVCPKSTKTEAESVLSAINTNISNGDHPNLPWMILIKMLTIPLSHYMVMSTLHQGRSTWTQTWIIIPIPKLSPYMDASTQHLGISTLTNLDMIIQKHPHTLFSVW